jgi:4-hydroxythreonine-4-phosphate dehydrogenase
MGLMHKTGKSPVVSPTGQNLIAITMGCPVGIGPEIILRFLARKKLPHSFLPVVIGDIAVLQRIAQELGIEVEIIAWQPGKQFDTGKIQVIEPEREAGYELQSKGLVWGVPGRETGQAAAAYIMESVRLVRQGELAAVVTCPIAKYALNLAGYNFPGHTEMLAALCDTKNFGMMMAGNRLKVALVTIHTPLALVAEKLNEPEIRRIITLTAETLVQDFALARPRIAVAGLNPHGGEAGLFGREEENIIAPAIAGSFSEKWEVAGPLPPDTVFKMAVDGKYDAVVAMYHDQGLIPFKIVHFEDGVNLTMGLPIVRTSVDHGTAYDIAGKGLASDSSLAAAFSLAARIINNRRVRA